MSNEDFSSYINLDECLKRLGGNKGIMARLLDKFGKDENYHELIGALNSGDIPKAANAAHTIKGMAANLSMTVLYEASAAYEKELKAGNNIPELFEAFREAMEKTVQNIHAATRELNA